MKDDGQSDAGEQHADVFDRRIGEQALHVCLHRGEDHAKDRRRQSQRERDQAPPPQRVADQVERHPQHAVDGGLQHDAAHERRHGRRCGRVRLREPDVQWQEPGLGAESEQREQEGGGCPGSRQRARAHGVEREQPGAALQDAEAQQDGDGTDVCHEQVQESRAANLRDAVLGGHQEIGRQGHRLPRDHEGVGVVGDQHESHAGEKEVVLESQHPRRGSLALAEIASREQRHAGRRAAEECQEHARKIVQPDVHGQVRQADVQGGVLHRFGEAQGSHDRETDTNDRAERKQHSADQRDAVGPQQSGSAHHCPAREKRQGNGQGRVDRGHVAILPQCKLHYNHRHMPWAP